MGGQVGDPSLCSSCRVCVVTVVVRSSHRSPRRVSIEERERVNGHYFDLPAVGTGRGATELCGTPHKTVRRVIAAYEAGDGCRRPLARGCSS